MAIPIIFLGTWVQKQWPSHWICTMFMGCHLELNNKRPWARWELCHHSMALGRLTGLWDQIKEERFEGQGRKDRWTRWIMQKWGNRIKGVDLNTIAKIESWTGFKGISRSLWSNEQDERSPGGINILTIWKSSILRKDSLTLNVGEFQQTLQPLNSSDGEEVWLWGSWCWGWGRGQWRDSENDDLDSESLIQVTMWGACEFMGLLWCLYCHMHPISLSWSLYHLPLCHYYYLSLYYYAHL